MIRVLTRVLIATGAALLLFACLPAPNAAAAKPTTVPSVKPPAPIPDDIASGQPGVDEETGHYCTQDDPDPKKAARCRPLKPGEVGGTVEPGEGGGSEEERHAYEVAQLKKWRKKADTKDSDYKGLNAFLQKCVVDEPEKKGNGLFRECLQRGKDKYPGYGHQTAGEWISGKISEAAAKGLDEAAAKSADATVWLLQKFAGLFDRLSTIDLTTSGIGPALSLTTGLSLLVACFLLLIQWGKLAISMKGEALATIVIGLPKWAAISAVYVTATMTALTASDRISTWLIRRTIGPGAPADAMRKSLEGMFSGLVGNSSGGGLITVGATVAGAVAIIAICLVCILAIGALWLEMLMREAGILLLIVVMPIVVAGQLADAGREWWPRARNALIALVLMKVVIVLAFGIGATITAGSTGISNVMVGLMIFLLAAVSWPALARFMVFTSVGEGSSAASGGISTAGSSASSSAGGMQSLPSGAGAVSGGAGYTKAAESENSSGAASSKGGTGFAGKARAGTRAVGALARVGAQAGAIAKDTAESAAQNAAAHAGLGQGTPGGRHAFVHRPGGGGGRGGGGRRRGSSPGQQTAAPSESEPPPRRPAPPRPRPSSENEKG